jgi:hypothetical protein
MMITLQDAINHLYDLAVHKGKTQSPARLKVLADYCIQELDLRGVRGALAEQGIPGGGRPKTWDIAWQHQGKRRLAISLKSILKNLAGTVPNRIDDLMGEAANAQLYSPEIVIGYVMILDVSSDAYSAKHGSTWSDLLRSRLSRLSGRCPPAWTIGTVEAFAYAEVDFSKSPVLRPSTTSFESFFDVLSEQVKLRNPSAFPDEPAAT